MRIDSSSIDAEARDTLTACSVIWARAGCIASLCRGALASFTAASPVIPRVWKDLDAEMDAEVDEACEVLRFDDVADVPLAPQLQKGISASIIRLTPTERFCWMLREYSNTVF